MQRRKTGYLLLLLKFNKVKVYYCRVIFAIKYLSSFGCFWIMLVQLPIKRKMWQNKNKIRYWPGIKWLYRPRWKRDFLFREQSRREQNNSSRYTKVYKATLYSLSIICYNIWLDEDVQDMLSTDAKMSSLPPIPPLALLPPLIHLTHCIRVIVSATLLK